MDGDPQFLFCQMFSMTLFITELIVRWLIKREAFRFLEELDILESGKSQQEDTVAKTFEECEIDPTSSFKPNLSPKSEKEDAQKSAASV